MSITLLTIPESSADWPAWLDRQLMEFRLLDLIEELQLLKSEPNSEPNAAANQTPVTLANVVDTDQQARVLESGTSVLSVPQFQLLFGHPLLLLELQERILEAGGEYWNRFGLSPELQAMSDRILKKLDLSADTQSSDFGSAAQSGPASSAGPRGNRRKLMWLASSLAAVLLMISFLQRTPELAEPTGLSNPALLAADVQTAQQWFDLVADAGKMWQTEPHQNSEQLLQALSETSEACGRLIANPHPILDAAESAWFVTKCQNWKTKLDDTYAALTTGDLSFLEAKTQADGIMNKLVTVLQAGPQPEVVASTSGIDIPRSPVHGENMYTPSLDDNAPRHQPGRV